MLVVRPTTRFWPINLFGVRNGKRRHGGLNLLMGAGGWGSVQVGAKRPIRAQARNAKRPLRHARKKPAHGTHTVPRMHGTREDPHGSKERNNDAQETIKF